MFDPWPLAAKYTGGSPPRASAFPIHLLISRFIQPTVLRKAHDPGGQEAVSVAEPVVAVYRGGNAIEENLEVTVIKEVVVACIST